MYSSTAYTFSQINSSLNRLALDLAIRSVPANAALLDIDILLHIFSWVVEKDRPSLCSCSKHAPNSAELMQRPCCDGFPECQHREEPACVRGRPFDSRHCVHNLGWIKLGHICHHWRSVLQGIGRFWANDLCTLNNSALVHFLSYAKGSPLTIDLTPEKVQNMVHPATRRERAELLRPHIPRARVVRCGWYSWTPASFEQPLPLLETLVLSTEIPSTVSAPTLQHAVSNEGPLYHQAMHSASHPIILNAPSLRTLYFRLWERDRYVEIPRMLLTVSSITHLLLGTDHPNSYYNQRDIDTDDALDAREILDVPDGSLHLPALTRLQVLGPGAGHPIIRRLIAHLATNPQGALQQLSVQRINPSFLRSHISLDALRSHIRAVHPDNISFQFRDSCRTLVMSVARQRPGDERENYPSTTINVNIHDAAHSWIDILEHTLFPLVPLGEIHHLYLDSLPEVTGTQFQFSRVLRQLCSVRTLHLHDHHWMSSTSLLRVGLYPIVGLRFKEKPWLPALSSLHIAYPSEPEKLSSWWQDLEAALRERREKHGVPITTLRVLIERDVSRLEDDAVRTIQREMDKMNLFVPNFSSAGFQMLSVLQQLNYWTRDMIEDRAVKALAQIVETIEVVEEKEDGWPPRVEMWKMEPRGSGL
ncbi:unnamed protein product [Peniophora sp. CBMAI 1063]|nr:unnamed protein product [Peniophora sp. CBMAI 1063]